MTAAPVQRLRLRYRKDEVLMWVGHLDVMRLVIKLLRRAEIPFATHGKFSPKPCITYGPPLALGVSAEGELLDIELREGIAWDPDQVMLGETSLARAALPRDFVAGLASLAPDAASVAKAAVAGRYIVCCPTGAEAALQLVQEGGLTAPNRDGKPVPVARGMLALKEEGGALLIDGAVSGAEVFNVMRLVHGLEAAGYPTTRRHRVGLVDMAGRLL